MTGHNWFQMIFTIILVIAFGLAWCSCVVAKRADKRNEENMKRWSEKYATRKEPTNEIK